MTKPIENKVTIKLYGEKLLSAQLVNILKDAGYNAYGKVKDGNRYTTQKEETGWASTVTFFRPDKMIEDEK